MEVIHYATFEQIAQLCPSAVKLLNFAEMPGYQDVSEAIALILGWIFGYDKPDHETAIEVLSECVHNRRGTQEQLDELCEVFYQVDQEFNQRTGLRLMPCHFYEDEQDSPLGQWGVKGMCQYTPAGEKFADIFVRHPILE